MAAVARSSGENFPPTLSLFVRRVEQIMAPLDDSTTTNELELESLVLDMKALHRTQEEDRREFQDFQTTVNRNFALMQSNFDKIQENFKKLLLEPDLPDTEVNGEQFVQGSVQNRTPQGQMQPAGRPKQLPLNLNNGQQPGGHLYCEIFKAESLTWMVHLRMCTGMPTLFIQDISLLKGLKDCKCSKLVDPERSTKKMIWGKAIYRRQDTTMQRIEDLHSLSSLLE